MYSLTKRINFVLSQPNSKYHKLRLPKRILRTRAQYRRKRDDYDDSYYGSGYDDGISSFVEERLFGTAKKDPGPQKDLEDWEKRVQELVVPPDWTGQKQVFVDILLELGYINGIKSLHVHYYTVKRGALSFAENHIQYIDALPAALVESMLSSYRVHQPPQNIARSLTRLHGVYTKQQFIGVLKNSKYVFVDFMRLLVLFMEERTEVLERTSPGLISVLEKLMPLLLPLMLMPPEAVENKIRQNTDKARSRKYSVSQEHYRKLRDFEQKAMEITRARFGDDGLTGLANQQDSVQEFLEQHGLQKWFPPKENMQDLPKNDSQEPSLEDFFYKASISPGSGFGLGGAGKVHNITSDQKLDNTNKNLDWRKRRRSIKFPILSELDTDDTNVDQPFDSRSQSQTFSLRPQDDDQPSQQDILNSSAFSLPSQDDDNRSQQNVLNPSTFSLRSQKDDQEFYHNKQNMSDFYPQPHSVEQESQRKQHSSAFSFLPEDDDLQFLQNEKNLNTHIGKLEPLPGFDQNTVSSGKRVQGRSSKAKEESIEAFWKILEHKKSGQKKPKKQNKAVDILKKWDMWESSSTNRFDYANGNDQLKPVPRDPKEAQNDQETQKQETFLDDWEQKVSSDADSTKAEESDDQGQTVGDDNEDNQTPVKVLNQEEETEQNELSQEEMIQAKNKQYEMQQQGLLDVIEQKLAQQAEEQRRRQNTSKADKDTRKGKFYPEIDIQENKAQLKGKQQKQDLVIDDSRKAQSQGKFKPKQVRNPLYDDKQKQVQGNQGKQQGQLLSRQQKDQQPSPQTQLSSKKTLKEESALKGAFSDQKQQQAQEKLGKQQDQVLIKQSKVQQSTSQKGSKQQQVQSKKTQEEKVLQEKGKPKNSLSEQKQQQVQEKQRKQQDQLLTKQSKVQQSTSQSGPKQALSKKTKEEGKLSQKDDVHKISEKQGDKSQQKSKLPMSQNGTKQNQVQSKKTQQGNNKAVQNFKQSGQSRNLRQGQQSKNRKFSKAGGGKQRNQKQKVQVR